MARMEAKAYRYLIFSPLLQYNCGFSCTAFSQNLLLRSRLLFKNAFLLLESSADSLALAVFDVSIF